jgi:hypothetical protein
MLFKQVGRAHVTGQHIGGAVAADFRHFGPLGAKLQFDDI